MDYASQINHIRQLAIDIHNNAQLTLREALAYGWTPERYAEELVDDYIAYIDADPQTYPPKWWTYTETRILYREMARLVDVDRALCEADLPPAVEEGA